MMCLPSQLIPNPRKRESQEDFSSDQEKLSTDQLYLSDSDTNPHMSGDKLSPVAGGDSPDQSRYVVSIQFLSLSSYNLKCLTFALLKSVS